MPELGRVLVLRSGDTLELLETSAMTGGAYVRARYLFKARGLHVPAHIHPRQDETFQVLSGRLTYVLDGAKHCAEAGETVKLPRGVPHQHHSEGPQDTVVLQTIEPGLDFDLLVENIFGLGAEGRGLEGLDNVIQGLVWIRRMRSTLLLGAVPRWLQYSLAWLMTPLAETLGYRAVHPRFSGGA